VDEILRVEGNLRRQRQAALQARQEQLRNLVIGAILFVVLPIGFGLLYFFAVYLKGLDYEEPESDSGCCGPNSSYALLEVLSAVWR
jgi:hypothetical protein